jgi:hypothetical protein
VPLLLPPVKIDLLEPNQIQPKSSSQPEKEKPSAFNAQGKRSASNQGNIGLVEDFNPSSEKELITPSSPDSQTKEETQKQASGWQKLKNAITQPSKTKQIIGKVLMAGVAAGAIALVSTTGSSSSASAWPAGYWYVAAMAFDQGVFHPVASLLQFSLLYSYVSKPGLPAGFKVLTRWLINKDILKVFDQ